MPSVLVNGSSVRVSTLVDIVRLRALKTPEEPAYRFLVDGEREEAVISYGELDGRAESIAARLEEVVRPGARVVLLYPAGLEFIAAFLGCQYAGAIPVPLPIIHSAKLKQSISKFNAIVANAEPAAGLTTAAALPLAEAASQASSGHVRMAWIATDGRDTNAARAYSQRHAAPSAVAFLQYTSGSTSTPRGVAVTHANLLNNLELIRASFRLSSLSRVVMWLPPYHDMGLVGGLLEPLYAGFAVVSMSPLAFLQRPYRWLEVISRFQADTSAAPNFAYDLAVRRVTSEQRATLDLSHWRTALNGSEPVNHATLARFAEYFAPCGFTLESFRPSYGLAESTLLVSCDATTASPQIRHFDAAALERRQGRLVSDGGPVRTLVSCGRTLPGHQVRIADPESHTRSAPGEIGEIWVAGPSVAQGYWNRAEDTAQTFHAFLADTGEGPFLRTGDLGFFQREDLFVTGRLKDLIIVDGSNHYSHDIERTVEQCHHAIRQNGCAAFSIDGTGVERVIVYAELDHHWLRSFDEEVALTEITRSVRRAVNECHGLKIDDLLLLRPGAIPKTSSGKIQRHTCRVQYLSGNVDSLRINHASR